MWDMMHAQQSYNWIVCEIMHVVFHLNFAVYICSAISRVGFLDLFGPITNTGVTNPIM